MRFFSTILFFILSVTALYGSDGEKAKKSFTDIFPGSPVLTIFANHHTALSDGAGPTEFEWKRGYVGYKFDNGGEWSGKVVFDITAANTVDSDLEFTAYLKNALVSWSRDRINVDFGIIRTKNFAAQEKIWGYRYIMKSFGDEYDFAPSADLGISVSYKFTDYIEADFNFTNGKGFKKLTINNNFRYGFGLTLKPLERLTFRTYYDLYSRNVYGAGDASQHNISAMVEYRHPKFTVGGEHSYMFNSKFRKGADRAGLSLSSTVKVVDKLDVFARYDNLYLNEDIGGESGGAIRAGFDYHPFNFLRLSPNIYCWNPDGGATETYLYLNLLINF